MSKTYFVSFNIIDHQHGRGIVGSGNTIVTLTVPFGQKALRFIEDQVIAPSLPHGTAGCVMNIVPVEGDGS